MESKAIICDNGELKLEAGTVISYKNTISGKFKTGMVIGATVGAFIVQDIDNSTRLVLTENIDMIEIYDSEVAENYFITLEEYKKGVKYV